MDAGAASWDFFISYTQADLDWAVWIAWELEEAKPGYRILIQEWDSVPGTDLAATMDVGIRTAARTIAVLSDAYLKSVYCGAEWRAAWATDPAGAERKLVPVRIEDCDRPGPLATRVSFDLFNLDEVSARQQLLAKVKAAVDGRDRPERRPLFPEAAEADAQASLDRTVRSPRDRAVPRFPGPRVWNAPRRNPNFTGRRVDLARLVQGFNPANAATARSMHGPRGEEVRTVTVQAVRGLGGVGKTALAAEYAYRHGTEYDVLWWIQADMPDLLPKEFAELARKLGFPELARQLDAEPADAADDARRQILDLLDATPGWLLIFDNANAAADIRPWVPTGLRPADGPGHVIVTTRRGFRQLDGKVHELEVFGTADALKLIQTRVPGLAKDTAEDIAAELEWLPFALEQAGAYLDFTGERGAEYLKQLRDDPADLYRRGQGRSHPETIATLWNASLDQVAADSPAAIQFLEVCAYLAPEPIRLDLFIAHPGLPELPPTANGDQVGFTDVVAVLADYSLARRSQDERSQDVLKVSRFIQAAVRARRDTARKRGETGRQPLLVALQLLRLHAPAEGMSDLEKRERWEALLPHVLAATEFVNTAQLHDDPPLRDCAVWLVDKAGIFLQGHGRREEARPLLERALRMAEAAYGPNDGNVGKSLNNLAAILRDLGQAAKALPKAERAVKITAVAFAPSHPDVTTSLNTLAAIHRDLGHPEDARSVLKRVPGIYEAACGPDHHYGRYRAEVAVSLSILAAIERDLGRPDEAHRLLERALAINKAAYGSDHPVVAHNLRNLAVIRRDLGRQ
jgi:tetratricopeptide (TPR) repeat protein